MLLKLREAAKYLAVSAWKLRRLVGQGLPYVCDGDGNSAWRFDIADLDAWIEAHKVRL
jgi:excisionase family DNA binding protein